MKEKIELLIQLQNTDLASDAIDSKKGSLPHEIAKFVQDLDNLENDKIICQDKIAYEKGLINEQKGISKKAKDLVAQYKQDHLNTINNKEEYDNITQEIALQELEISLAKKRIKTSQEHVTRQEHHIKEIDLLIKENKEMTQRKQARLEKIAEETQEEERKLKNQRIAIIEKINDPQLLQQYENLRQRFPFVVATVQEEACNGCFIIVPTQRQIKIREGKKIFMCETCGRMLVKADKEIESTP